MLSLDNLRNLLNEDGKGSQTRLAKATGISSGNISDWFNQNKKALPSAESLCKIAEYYNCSVDYILNRTNIKYPIDDIPNGKYVYVCSQEASAGIGKIKDESNPDLKIVCFEENTVPRGTTHGIIINGHSMEDKFFDKQIVFIQNGKECDSSDYGIFSVTDDHLETKIYCKQLMQKENGEKYLHSFNTNEPDPDIDYKSVIDVHCIGKILQK